MYLNKLIDFDSVTEKCSRAIALENSKRSLKGKKKKRGNKQAFTNSALKYSSQPLTPELCELMHSSWTKMILTKTMDEALLSKIELCGAKATIKSSLDAHVVGLEGIIVRENSEYIFFHTRSSSNLHRINKKGTVININCGNTEYKIDFTRFGDPSLRHKKGIRGMTKS